MCGFAGLLQLDYSTGVDREMLVRMRDALTHRGPDDSGLYASGPIGLGFRRLSVIDIPGGHQPMIDPVTGLALVFNGEIYNYRTLRQELEGDGHCFHTESDTEVILKSYLQWEADAVKHLTGMFAFAIWDPRTQTLMFARDRLGIKPLFWTRVGNQILFASEVKAFFQHPDFVTEADLDAISSYLTFRQPVWDLSFFRGVHKVLPGRRVIVKEGHITESTYWRLPVPQPDETLDEAAYLERVEVLLRQAVKRCLIADIPIGAYLSGGLDSSLIVALMSQMAPHRLHTFSIGYMENEYDEGEYAKVVATHFETEHTHLLITQQACEDSLAKLIQHRDVPLSIPHEIPLYHLSAELKRSVSVAIAGDGADELFGGYGRVLRSPFDWQKIAFARALAGGRFVKRIGSLSALKGTALAWLRFERQIEHFFHVYNWIPFEEKWALLTADVLQAIDQDARTIGVFEEIFAEVASADPYDRVLHVFQKIHLGCLLDKLDAMGMAASVEGRVPFVDHELVEFVVNMPIRYKLRWNSIWSHLRALTQTADRVSERFDTTKYLLRQLGSKLLPETITHRKKLGFPTPLDLWLRDGLMEMARDVLLDKTARERGLFRPEAITALLTKPQDLPFDFYGKKIWMLMNVELWFREVLDARAAAMGHAERANLFVSPSGAAPV